MFERKLSINSTFSATGRRSIDLQVGNLTRGVLCGAVTGFTGASPAPSFGRMSLAVDSTETLYHSTDFEVAHGVHSLWGRQPAVYDDHKHRVTTDGNAQTALSTSAGPIEVGAGWDKYCYLECDPTRDDSFAIDTKDNRRFELLSDVETAETVRVVQVEAVSTASLK